jgi:CubicO group peptidase (beta-lactamase class C family)
MVDLYNQYAAGPLDRLEAQFEYQTGQQEVPGIVALAVRNGLVVKAIVTGWQDADRTVAMRRDTIFRIASMSKPVTAVAALILMEQGHMELESPIERWLPEFKNMMVLCDAFGPLDTVVQADRQITVLDLLTHRAGLAYPSTLAAPLGNALIRVDQLTDEICDAQDWITELSALPLAYQPGSNFLYGLSSDVLGILIERVAQMPLGDFMQKHIFAPLTMGDTGFFVPPEKAVRLSAAFRPMSKTGTIGVFDEPGHNRWSNRERFNSGGGGLVSTADDYLQFAEMLMGRGKLAGTRILTARSVGLMTSDWLTPDQRNSQVFGRRYFAGQGYGLGVSVTDNPARQEEQLGYSSIGSFGWSGVYGTSWRADPQEKLNLIYMSQLSSTDFVIRQFARLSAAAYSST